MSIYETIMRQRRFGKERGILSLIASEICVDGKPMCDADSIKRLTQMVKVCNKNIKLYADALNKDMVFKEKMFKLTVESYLPKGAEKSDIENVIKELNVEKNMNSMGRVMGELKKSFAVVDGNLVKNILLGK